MSSDKEKSTMKTVPMDEQLEPGNELQALLYYAGLFTDQTTVRVIGALATSEQSTASLREIANLRPPDLSRLLDRLRWLGLINEQTNDGRTSYRLSENGLKRFGRAVQSVSKETFPQRQKSAVDLEEGEEWERKVLRNFFEGERLRELPASLKAFTVVLRWLVNQFEHDVRYHEREVNEILKRYHYDFATLRRGMIDAGLMRRENNIYWRT